MQCSISKISVFVVAWCVSVVQLSAQPVTINIETNDHAIVLQTILNA